MNAMKWDRLLYFRSVARLAHVSRAAEELGMTQPALSRAIAHLERDIGTALFERQGRTIALTPSGRVFLRHVERAIDAVDAGKREVAEIERERADRVSLGFLRSLGAGTAPQLVRSFLTSRRGARFSFAQSNGVTLETMLVGGDVSLALIAQPEAAESFHWERFTTQRFAVIVPPGHRFAGRRSIAVAALRCEPFVSFKIGHALRTFTDALCARRDFAPTIVFEADDSNSIRGFVNAGFGVAVVPRAADSDQLPSIAIGDRDARREIGIARVVGRHLSPMEEAFRRFVVDAASVCP